MPSDDEWVNDLRGGDEAVRARAAADLRDYLRRTLAKGFQRQLADADLEDLAQESTLRIHQKLDTFTGQSRFTTWAASVAVNCALSELRKRRYRHVTLDEAAAQVDWSSENQEEEAVTELLQRAIAEALTERQRSAIQAVLGGLPLMELARREGVSQGAIYKMLHDARRRLRTYLDAAKLGGVGMPEVVS